MSATPPGAAPEASLPGGQAQRVVGALGLVVVFVLLAAAVDGFLTGVLERRLAARIGQALATPVRVDLQGWPVVPRLLAGVLPGARVVKAPGTGQPSAVTALEARLTGIDIGAAALLDGTRPLSLTAAQARLEASFDEGTGPLGTVRMSLSAEELSARLGPRESRVALGSARIDGGGPSPSSGGAPEQLVDAWLGDVLVSAQHDHELGEGPALTARRGWLQARGEEPEALPLSAASIALEFDHGSARLVRGGLSLAAGHAHVTASQVLLPSAPARISRLEATLPQLEVGRGAPGLDAGTAVLRSRGGTFVVELAEQAANALWPYPGEVSFLQDRARVTVGSLAVDVDVAVEGDRLLLRPRLPPPLGGLVNDALIVSMAPNLPGGALLQTVEVRADVLILRGSAPRLEIALARAAASGSSGVAREHPAPLSAERRGSTPGQAAAQQQPRGHE